MDHLDTNELIEQYLKGLLPTTEHEEVEERISTDAAFSDTVELHRQLHRELADPKKLELRDLLTDIMREPPSKQYHWLKGLAIAVIVLLAGWVGWRWLSPARERISPTFQEGGQKNSPTAKPNVTPETLDTTEPPEPKPQRPFVMADPAAFAPNRAFEDRLGSKTRDTNEPASLQSPATGANFVPENGIVQISFRGTAPASNDTAQFPLMLKIFDNQPASTTPLFQVKPAIGNWNSSTEKWTFRSAQRLRLRPGLYYFTLERQEDEDLIYVGKFTVGAR